jgi:membrane dipeptidase
MNDLGDVAARIVTERLVWDSHGCMPLRPADEMFLPELQRYRRAGVDVVFINVGFGDDGIEAHVRMIAHFRRWLVARPDEYVLATDVAAIEHARATGRLAVGFDIEGMNAIDDQLSLISLYYDLGVRWMLIAYNRNNRAGGGCRDGDNGLTEFGRRTVEEMARVGMLLCCSHTGERTSREAIDLSPNPVIFSHSNPRAMWDHHRNISDDLMRACAARGGVIGINGIGIFLGANDNRAETVASHIDYAVSLVGDDHVGIGLDYVFDEEELKDLFVNSPHLYAGYDVEGGLRMVSPEQIQAIVEELLRRGYSEEALGKILGGNFLRVARQVWR